MNKLISKLVGVALGLTLAVGTGVAVATSARGVSKAEAIESAAYTLDGTKTGGSSGYADESTITQDSVEWGVTGNTTMNPWRIGGKNLTNVDRLVKSNAAVSSEDITKVVLTVGTTNLTVNSLSLLVGTSAGGSQTSTVAGTFVASSSITFNRPSGADWSKDDGMLPMAARQINIAPPGDFMIPEIITDQKAIDGFVSQPTCLKPRVVRTVLNRPSSVLNIQRQTIVRTTTEATPGKQQAALKKDLILPFIPQIKLAMIKAVSVFAGTTISV